MDLLADKPQRPNKASLFYAPAIEFLPFGVVVHGSADLGRPRRSSRGLPSADGEGGGQTARMAPDIASPRIDENRGPVYLPALEAGHTSGPRSENDQGRSLLTVLVFLRGKKENC